MCLGLTLTTENKVNGCRGLGKSAYSHTKVKPITGITLVGLLRQGAGVRLSIYQQISVYGCPCHKLSIASKEFKNESN